MRHLRLAVDIIDTVILFSLAARSRVGAAIAREKKEKGFAIKDLRRESEVEGRALQMAQSLGMRPEFALKLYRLVLDESVAQQRNQLQKP